MDDSKSSNPESFRLNSIEEVVNFLKVQICEKDEDEVDLVLISILLGFIEHQLTRKDDAINLAGDISDVFPIINSEEIIPLVDDFRQYIRGKVIPKMTTGSDSEVCTERQTIKDVANAVWKRLSKAFHKDKLHFQTLYTFKNGKFSNFLIIDLNFYFVYFQAATWIVSD